MADGKKYFCFCSSNCKYETMTKEQILAAIVQAVENGEVQDVDSGFVTTIKDQNQNSGLTFWIGTTAQYNALESIDMNCMYILTDETTDEDMAAYIAQLNERVEAMQESVALLQAFGMYATASNGVLLDALEVDKNNASSQMNAPAIVNLTTTENLPDENFNVGVRLVFHCGSQCLTVVLIGQNKDRTSVMWANSMAFGSWGGWAKIG